MSLDTLPRLRYFAIEGVAEKVRLAFVLLGQPFTDDRFSFADWSEIKKTTPFGQVPVLHLPVTGVDSSEEQVIAQSGAMVRYLCLQDQKGAGGVLYPVSNPAQFLLVEEAIGLVEDFLRAWFPALYIGMRPQALGHSAELSQEEKDAVTKKLREGFYKGDNGDGTNRDGSECAMKRFMKSFEGMIEKNGKQNGFLCGAEITAADLWLLPQLRYFIRGVADHVPADVLGQYPVIIGYIGRMMANKKIGEWYKAKE